MALAGVRLVSKYICTSVTQLIDAQHTNSFKLETKMKLRGSPNKSDSPATIKAKEKAKEPEEKPKRL